MFIDDKDKISMLHFHRKILDNFNRSSKAKESFSRSVIIYKKEDFEEMPDFHQAGFRCFYPFRSFFLPRLYDEPG